MLEEARATGKPRFTLNVGGLNGNSCEATRNILGTVDSEGSPNVNQPEETTFDL